MIGKFQKHLSARAKQHDTSLWKHFFRPAMLYVTLFGVLWLAPSSVVAWAGISAKCSELTVLHFCLCVRTSPGAGDTSADVSRSPKPFFLPVGCERSLLVQLILLQGCCQRHSVCEELKDAHPECSQECPSRAPKGMLVSPAGFLAAELPLPVFLPERLTSIGTFQRKKKAKVTSFSNFWKECVLFLLPVESYKNTLTCFTH